MTIHMARVWSLDMFISSGWKGPVSSQMMLSNRADLEEERRLFYVTRAKSGYFYPMPSGAIALGDPQNCEPVVSWTM